MIILNNNNKASTPTYQRIKLLVEFSLQLAVRGEIVTFHSYFKKGEDIVVETIKI